MIRPHFEPQPDNTFRIEHAPEYRAFSVVLRKIEVGELAPADAETRLKEILRKYPWHFEAAIRLAELYTATGAFQKACDTRFAACQRLMELLPEEDDADPIPLDFEKKENQCLLFLLQGSAIDHFLICEFELAAALLETLLDLDEEDHLNASQTLAYCYVALGERDSFEAILPDLDDKNPEKALAERWAQRQFDGKIASASLAEFQRKHPAVYREFTADEHPVTEAYLADIDGERPSSESRARLLWLKTEHLWQQFPEFIVALKNTAKS